MDLVNWLWLSLLLAAVAVTLASPIWRRRVKDHATLLAGLVVTAVIAEMTLRFFGFGISWPLSAWAVTLFFLWVAISLQRRGVFEPPPDKPERGAEEQKSPPAIETPAIDDPFRGRPASGTGGLARVALDQAAHGIAAIDLEGKVELVNPAWARMHGVRVGEARGHHLSLFHTPDQVQLEVRARLVEAREAGVWEGEAGHRRNDGSVFRTAASLSLLRDEATGEPSGYVIIAHEVGAPDESGEDREPVPQEAGPDSETLSLLVGNVAHEFNNLLTGILGNAGLASRLLPAGGQGQEELQDIQTASRRAAELARLLQSYCGKPEALRDRALPAADAAGRREVGKAAASPYGDAPPRDAAVAPAGGAPPRDAAAVPWRGSGTILVVDNEKIIRDLATTILETYGFSVLTADDGEPAVELYRERGSDFRAVLLDLSMPLMDGGEAFRQIRRLDPGAQVILMTGHPAREVLADFEDQRPAGVLQKPFKPDQLVDALRGILDSGA